MQYAFAGPESSHDTLFWQTNSLRAGGWPKVYKSPPKTQNTSVLTAPENGALPRSRHHPYEAQLDALESVLCSTTLTQALGTAPLRSVTDLGLLLERYRTTVLEPIELPAIARLTVKPPKAGHWSLLNWIKNSPAKTPNGCSSPRPAPAWAGIT